MNLRSANQSAGAVARPEPGDNETSALTALQALEQTCTDLATLMAQDKALCGLVGSAGSGKTSVLRVIAAATGSEASIRQPGQQLNPETRIDLLDDVGEDALTHLAAVPAFRGVRVLAMRPSVLHRFVDLFPDAKIARVRPMTTADTLAMVKAYVRRHALGEEALAAKVKGTLEAYAAGNPRRLGQLLRQACAVAAERACSPISADQVDKAARELGMVSGPRDVDGTWRSSHSRQPGAAKPRVAPATSQSRGSAITKLVAAAVVAAVIAFGAYSLGDDEKVTNPGDFRREAVVTTGPTILASVLTPTPEPAGPEATATVAVPWAYAVPTLVNSSPTINVWPAGTIMAAVLDPDSGVSPIGDTAVGPPAFFIYPEPGVGDPGRVVAEPSPPTASDAGLGRPAPERSAMARTESISEKAKVHSATDGAPERPAPLATPARPPALDDPAAGPSVETSVIPGLPETATNPEKAARLLGLGKVLLSIGQVKDALVVLRASADLGSTEAAVFATAASTSSMDGGPPRIISSKPMFQAGLVGGSDAR